MSLGLTLARLIASGFGCGFIPLAPGTIASALTLIPGTLLLLTTPQLLPAVALVAALAGLWAISAARVTGDPGWVVIDEVAGQLLALYGLPHASLKGVLAAFVVFRLLDVTKPGPIGWADRQKNAAGIMADDVLAGAITAGIVWAINVRWPALFS
ncbi:MAG TPA: phosphatidylglycerophosphatase A [Acetobacteraceae bacterium]|nr:phosphatidylglycerophosphatase A [Acetobacteraceae bacterium]